MKVRVEARPLHEPLAGGRQGATVTVEPMVAGRCNLPIPYMEDPGGRLAGVKVLRSLLSWKPSVVVPIPAFLIRHPSAGPVLVDTGFHPSISTDGRENFGPMVARGAQPVLEPGEDVPSQLRAKGLEPTEVPVVVMTHMHFDHTSAISEFPNSTFVVSEPEWVAAARGPKPLLNGYIRKHFDYAFDFRTVDFDRGGIDSYATFGRAFDLFGDGSVRLAFTPGHTIGHMSVIARLRDRDFVIGGDVVFMKSQLDGGSPLPPRPQDAHNYRRSLQEARLFRSQFPNAIVTPGHDPDFYASIEERYQ